MSTDGKIRRSTWGSGMAGKSQNPRPWHRSASVSSSINHAAIYRRRNRASAHDEGVVDGGVGRLIQTVLVSVYSSIAADHSRP
jgi:hypothetical protein